jgi:hypothetical protein
MYMHADCARAMEERVRRNKSLNTDPFFTMEESACGFDESAAAASSA